jgi:predicted RNase H-like HicB family nuclease
MSTITLKADTLYLACSPELGVVTYGQCQDEALNNLTEEIRQHQAAEE